MFRFEQKIDAQGNSVYILDYEENGVKYRSFFRKANDVKENELKDCNGLLICLDTKSK